MLPNEISEASNVIFGFLTNPSNDNLSTAITQLSQGECGQLAQRLIIDSYTALERFDDITRTINYLKSTAGYIRSQLLTSPDRFGQAVDPGSAFRDRLYGNGGLIDSAIREFGEIVTNFRHIADQPDEDSVAYWHWRMKQFRLKLADEISYYADAARYIIESYVLNFNSQSSSTMNHVLAAKVNTEQQQELLIEANTAFQKIGFGETAKINSKNFRDFIAEALQNADNNQFEQHMLGSVSMTPHLNLLEDLYERLSDGVGKEWRGVQQFQNSFLEKVADTRDGCIKSVEQMLTNLDYSAPFNDAAIIKIIEPLDKLTSEALAGMKFHSTNWAHLLVQQYRNLELAVHAI